MLIMRHRIQRLMPMIIRHRIQMENSEEIRRMIGWLTNQMGRENERRVLIYLREECSESWVYDARFATSEEDSRGIDVVVKTDVGEIFIQVKSSKAGKKGWNGRRKRKIVFVIAHADEEKMRAGLMLALRTKREAMQKKKLVDTLAERLKQKSAQFTKQALSMRDAKGG